MVKQFKLWNTICGWLVFAIAAATYLLTMEPTASFWDCGEFISSAAKLDVGHPPGAPFFMLMGHFFSLFASSPGQVAACVNALSALASAFTILFLFWTITALAKKLVEPDTLWRQIGLLAAGAVGALAYTFSDTFWFSAVEGEVYASSSLFTAVVFWLILKWDEHADEDGSDKWLIAIAYLMGLSIGVHLLNLLTIPAIGLVYYFRRYRFSWWSFIAAFLASCVVLLVILYGIIPGFPTVAGWFELLFINSFHCPFNTGLAIYIVLMVAALVWAIVETYLDKNKIRIAISFTLAFALSGAAFLFESWLIGLMLSIALLSVLVYKRDLIPASVLNTISVMIAVIIIGYSSYAAIVIRSNAKTPMDQNSPSNVFALKYYLNREQYGDRPLFFGQYYNAPMKVRKSCDGGLVYDIKDGAPQYMAVPHEDGQPDLYVVSGYKPTYTYQKEFCTIFPRMYSSDENHIRSYKSWVGMRDYNDAKTESDRRIILRENKHRKKDIRQRDLFFGRSEESYDFCPTFGDNLRFFFSYQSHFMYWRYFMWNFVGRQNDLLSYGDITKGQWISGIPFIDNARLGDQSKLPKELLENKGRNTYYFLPLILGILGICWQVSRRGKEHQAEGARNFTLTFLLFFLTGLAIVIYLNQTPLQPRERDYAYAGSFYAFCIWIGMGALALIDWLNGLLAKTQNNERMKVAIAAVLTVACLLVPLQMATQNWDDHDRSQRYVCRDFGANYLKSCEPGGILFSNGDNDTFPLWYNQEVEGVGDSLRVCNLSYLQTDWYINQMKRPYYHSEALPISWDFKDYQPNTNEYVQVRNIYGDSAISVKSAFDFLRSDDKATKTCEGKNFLPSNNLFVPTPEGGQVRFARKNGFTRADMMTMEMLSTNNWQRPIYFCATVGNSAYLGLEPYMELTGLAYQVTPYRSRDGQSRVNTVKMYDNMMNKFRYGNVKAHGIYIDENTMRMCDTHRTMFARLVEQLLAEGQYEKAQLALAKCNEELPAYNVPYGEYGSAVLMLDYFELARQLGAKGDTLGAKAANAQGNVILESVGNNFVEYVEFIRSLRVSKYNELDISDLNRKASILEYMLYYADRFGQASDKDVFMAALDAFKYFNDNKDKWIKDKKHQWSKYPEFRYY